MNARNYVAVLVCLGAIAGTAAASADDLAQACSAEAKQGAHGRGSAQRVSSLPRVTVHRQRCTPAPVQPKRGCMDDAHAQAANPPPPRGTEPSFGDVPVAVLMPPSPPTEAIPPGPAPVPARRKGGCSPRPAS